MFLALDSDEIEITNAAGSFLGGEFPLERLHTDQCRVVNLPAFAELGWLGLAASEEVGGSGLSQVEEMLFFLELGKVLGPVDVLTQVLAVAAAGDNAEIAGKLIGAEQSAALIVEQNEHGEARLIGSADADYALCITPDYAALYTFDDSACREVICLDRSVGMHILPVPALEEVQRYEDRAIWNKARINVAAMMLGVAQEATGMIVAYAKERQTFGRAIGSYQAVRHPCADMAVREEVARCQLYYAATAAKEGSDDLDLQIDAATLVAERAVKLNTDSNIQLHGGIGVTDEHSAHLLLKRANLLVRLFARSRQTMNSLLERAA